MLQTNTVTPGRGNNNLVLGAGGVTKRVRVKLATLTIKKELATLPKKN